MVSLGRSGMVWSSFSRPVTRLRNISKMMKNEMKKSSLASEWLSFIGLNWKANKYGSMIYAKRYRNPMNMSNASLYRLNGLIRYGAITSAQLFRYVPNYYYYTRMSSLVFSNWLSEFKWPPATPKRTSLYLRTFQLSMARFLSPNSSYNYCW